MMDIRTIRKLILLIKETGVGEIEVKTGDESVRINLSPSVCATTSLPAHTAYPLLSTSIESASTPATKLSTPPTTPAEDTAPAGHTLKSPMVGTAYLSPNPGSPKFVEIGTRVKKGDTVCFIEAMKMFNQIEADTSGVIKACLIENEQPIEYDQPLFIIDTD